VKGEGEKLLRLFQSLDAGQRRTLMAFAEFLSHRGVPAVPNAPPPVPEPRAANETVVKAIQRLTRTYPMLDRRKLLLETSRCVEQHVIHGRDSNEVITELELIFAQHYEKRKAGG
jgi:hypothetical protein